MLPARHLKSENFAYPMRTTAIQMWINLRLVVTQSNNKMGKYESQNHISGVFYGNCHIGGEEECFVEDDFWAYVWFLVSLCAKVLQLFKFNN